MRAGFDAFNAGDIEDMLARLSDDVAPHGNEGQIPQGKEEFGASCGHMSRRCRERLVEKVIFEAASGARAAAECIVEGACPATDDGLPEARGQSCRLPAGSFFSLCGGRITRVVTRCNLADWILQVSP